MRNGEANIVLFQCCEILAGFGEFSFFHTLTNVPVYEGALGVHEIELVIKTRPGFGNGGGVAKHGNASVDRGELASRNADGPGIY